VIFTTRIRGIALGLAILLSLSGGASALAARTRTTLPIIERQVMCVTCKIPLQVAESPQANDERAFIQELIDQGQTEAQIKRSLVAQYGQTVLALPSTHGFDLAAYLVPIVAALVLLAILAVLLPSWRRHARAASAASDAHDTSLSPSQTARLDEDLARFD
jgi:cytochrome c-type biogenesis protein CcmH